MLLVYYYIVYVMYMLFCAYYNYVILYVLCCEEPLRDIEGRFGPSNVQVESFVQGGPDGERLSILEVIPVSVKRNIPFLQALALQCPGRNFYPAPDLVL